MCQLCQPADHVTPPPVAVMLISPASHVAKPSSRGTVTSSATLHPAVCGEVGPAADQGAAKGDVQRAWPLGCVTAAPAPHPATLL